MRMRFVRALLTVGVALTASLMTVGPAQASAPDTSSSSDVGVQADPGPYLIQSQNSGWCLDSNFGGDVYMNPCQTGNRYQQWRVWNTGWTQNVATGRCLENGGGYYTYTYSCNSSKAIQMWQSWSGGWYKQVSASRCLETNYQSHAVRSASCTEIVNQFWRKILV